MYLLSGPGLLLYTALTMCFVRRLAVFLSHGPFSSLSETGYQLRLPLQNMQNFSEIPEALQKRLFDQSLEFLKKYIF